MTKAAVKKTHWEYAIGIPARQLSDFLVVNIVALVHLWTGTGRGLSLAGSIALHILHLGANRTGDPEDRQYKTYDETVEPNKQQRQ